MRAAWGKARLAAMRSGEPYVFRYEPKGSRYQIVLLSAITAEDADDVNTLRARGRRGRRVCRGRHAAAVAEPAPEEIVFASGEVAAVPQMAATAATSEGGWSAPIVFYPDGTTVDAAVLLANSAGLTLRVTLRGLTGISRTSEIGSEATP